MKKLFLAILAIAFITTAKAQSDFSFGPKAGLNITGVGSFDANAKASIHLGAFAEYKFCDRMSFQTELLYSRQGFSKKVDMLDNSSDVKVRYRVNYLNIPMLTKFYVLDNLSVDFGPQLGFAMNAKGRYKSNGTIVKEKIQDLNTVDLSLAMGASYELDMGLILSARYNQGLTNVFDKDAIGDANKNHVFQLSVGWRINL